MTGFIASAWLLVAIVLLTTTLSAARQPHPPGWLTDGRGGEMVSLLVVTALFFGCGYAGHFLATYDSQALLAVQSAALLATPLVGWLAWRVLRRSKRFRALLSEPAKAPAMVVPLPVEGPEVVPPTTPVRPTGGMRRAA